MPEFDMIAEVFWNDLEDMKSIECPCCERYAKYDVHRFTPGMAFYLLKAWEEHGLDPFKAKPYGSITTTKHWGMIYKEEMKGHYWSLTPKVPLFLRNRLSVPKSKTLYDDEVIYTDKERVRFREIKRTPQYGKVVGEWDGRKLV